jgi:hypothetical protein
MRYGSDRAIFDAFEAQISKLIIFFALALQVEERIFIIFYYVDRNIKN